MSNFRNVLKVYSLMRAFDADDNALLNTLRGATEPELELLRETLAPTKGTGKGLKKTRKPASRSPRAASLAGAIASNIRPISELPQHCGKCTQFADANVHHMQTDPNYHEFQPAAAQAAAGGE